MWHAGVVAVPLAFAVGVGLSKKAAKAPAKVADAAIPFTAPVESSPDKPDVLIVGAGIAGAALAAVLARDGRHVTLIERDLAEPDRIVGELLQPGGRRVLEEMGLEKDIDWSEIDSIIERGYIVHNGENSVVLSYPNDSVTGEQFEGRSFHHGRFVMQLRRIACAESRVRVVEGTVTKLIQEDDGNARSRVLGVEYRVKGDESCQQLTAPLTVIVDGCFSNFRKQLISNAPVVKSNFVGLVLKNVNMYKPHYAEVVLTRPNPVLIYQIGSEDTRVLVDVPHPAPKAAGGELEAHLRDHIAPQLPDHLRVPFLAALDSKLPLKQMPNSFLPPSALVRPGVVVLGDAFNMRHPLTGGGMTVAFSDVQLWRRFLRTLPNIYAPVSQRQIQAYVSAFHWQRKGSHSFVVNVLAQALHALFSANDPNLEELRDACFAYFELGGECASGPVGLLSILTPEPWTLIYHFFSVAVLGAKRIFKQYNPVVAVGKSTAVLYSACRVIFPLIASELW